MGMSRAEGSGVGIVPIPISAHGSACVALGNLFTSPASETWLPKPEDVRGVSPVLGALTLFFTDGGATPLPLASKGSSLGLGPSSPPDLDPLEPPACVPGSAFRERLAGTTGGSQDVRPPIRQLSQPRTK